MMIPFKFGDTGTPLTIYNKVEFDNWHEAQTEKVKTWLKNTSFKGEGLVLVPNFDTGSLNHAVVFVEDEKCYWHAGDLASQLPAGDYLLDGQNGHIKQTLFGFALGAYQFDTYKEQPPCSARLVVNNNELVNEATHLVKGVALVRDLVNTPAGDMMPQHLSEVMQDLANDFGGSFSEIVGDELLEQNYPTIHAVGRASINKPRLLDLRWGDSTHEKVTLVGKGVCFDSGGLDIKPGAGMRLMKKDMGGAAHVLGLAYLIMAFKLPICLRVMVPAVENAVSENAFRPGDVIKTRQGLTVEIDNTDAEGRLVLCDALTEACTENPSLIVDFATLTGACRIALGTELPGFFSDDKEVVNGLIDHGEAIDDNVWRLPLHTPYRSLLNSEIADISNCASGPFGGAITAGLYLKEFVTPSIPWVHFDVMAWNIRKLPGRPVGGEAFGVRAVFEYLKARYQS